MIKYITQNKNVLGGTPVIAGTRIPIQRIIYLMLKEGYNEANILEEYPHLPAKLLSGAIDEFIDTHEARTL